MERLHRDYLRERLQQPGFAGAYHELEPEFQVAREVIAWRLKRGLSQDEVARRAGTKQSVISRLESASSKPSLSFLQRVAEALGTRIEIRLVEPKESSP